VTTELQVIAAEGDPIQKPHEPEKAVLAAYFLSVGAKIVDAAMGAGVSERTLHYWRSCSWWPEMEAEAHRRWLSEVKAEARAALKDLVKLREATTVRFAAERLLPEFRQRAELSVDSHSTLDVNLNDAREKLRGRIASIADRN
jgi:hypothetical protein